MGNLTMKENCDSPPFIDIGQRLQSPQSQKVTSNTQHNSTNYSDIQSTQLLHLPLTQSQTTKNQPDLHLQQYGHSSRSSIEIIPRLQSPQSQKVTSNAQQTSTNFSDIQSTEQTALQANPY